MIVASYTGLRQTPLTLEKKQIDQNIIYGGIKLLKTVQEVAESIFEEQSNQSASLFELQGEGYIWIEGKNMRAKMVVTPKISDDTLSALLELLFARSFELLDIRTQTFDTPPLSLPHETFEQGTKEWDEYRLHGIGASEAAFVLNTCAFNKTAYYLWELKTKRREAEEASYKMNEGTELEERARAHLEQALDIRFFPVCRIHPEHSFIRCSLDGISIDGIILEIKSGTYAFTLAQKGVIPIYYLIQMQHQLACCPDAKYCLYYAYRPAKGGILMRVDRDERFIRELIEKETLFWKSVEEEAPPPYFEPLKASYLHESIKPVVKKSIVPRKRKIDEYYEKILKQPSLNES